MASQSLYRKWRSQTFSEMVGQEAVIRTLKNALQTQNLAHAYLFTGPRGTGKTSTARLLAKTINCLNPKDNEPCNECEQCREITAGNSFNVVEIDAASNRGIDSIRELREKVLVPPSTGKYKVYILDEAHMLTVEAFNALLKTLEEPPEHAIFVMATTDVHKMLPTVLSRCQRFDFKRFSTRQIVEHLQFVAAQEGVTLERGATELIARAAAGGMRDALSLLDQAIAYSGSTVSLAQVQTMLGVADPHAIRKFLSHIADLDSRAGLHLISELAEAGADLRQINAQVTEYWRSMMLAKAGAMIGEILDVTEDELNDIVQLAQRFSLDELIESSRIFAQNELMQKGLGAPQLGLELALLSCIELHRRNQGSSVQLHESTATLQAHAPAPSPIQSRPVQSVSAPAQPAPPAQRPSQLPTAAHPAPPAVSPTEESVRKASVVEPVVPLPEEPVEDDALPDWDAVATYDDEEPVYAPAAHQAEPVAMHVSSAPVSVQQEPALMASEEQESIVPVAEAAEGPSLTLQDVKEKWEYIKRRVKTKKDGAKLVAFLNGYAVVAVDGTRDQPVVVIRANMDFHYKALQNATAYHQAIEWAMKIELGQECKLRLLPPGQGGPSLGVSIPPPPAADQPGGKIANLRLASPPRNSVHVERQAPSVPSASAPVSAPSRVPEAAAPQVQSSTVVHRPVNPSIGYAAAPVVSPRVGIQEASVPIETTRVEHQSSSSLATKVGVRENTSQEVFSSQSTETRQASLEKSARHNQVVQEVARMFKAEIKDIQSK